MLIREALSKAIQTLIREYEGGVDEAVCILAEEFMFLLVEEVMLSDLKDEYKKGRIQRVYTMHRMHAINHLKNSIRERKFLENIKDEKLLEEVKEESNVKWVKEL